jgi:hypothetical protein
VRKSNQDEKVAELCPVRLRPESFPKYFGQRVVFRFLFPISLTGSRKGISPRESEQEWPF